MIFAVVCWLRFGLGRYAALAFLGAGMLALFSRGTEWRGEWAWTLDWAAGTTILSGSLLAGACAFEASLIRARRVERLTTGQPRSAAMTLASTVALWLHAVLAYLAVLLVAAFLTFATRPGGQPSLLPTVLALLVLAGFAGVGLLVGTVFAPWVAGPAGVAVGFGLTVLAANGTVPGIFRVGGVAGTLVGLTWAPRVNLEYAAALAGLCLLAWAIVRLRGSTVAHVSDIVALVVSLLLVGGAVLDLTVRGDERFQQAGSPGYVCAGSGPRTCLAQTTQRQLPALARAMTRSAQPLRDIGAVLPARFVQEIPGVPPDQTAGLMYLAPGEVNAAEPEAGRAADYLATPTACAEYYGDQPVEDALTARSVIADWIRFRISDQAPDSGNPGARWLGTHPGRAAAWVRDTYALLRSCRLDSIDLPFKP